MSRTAAYVAGRTKRARRERDRFSTLAWMLSIAPTRWPAEAVGAGCLVGGQPGMQVYLDRRAVMGSCRKARKQSASGSGHERGHCRIRGDTKDPWSCCGGTCGTDRS